MTARSDAYQLQHVRQEISRKISFPEELASQVDEDKGHQLLNELAGCKTHQALVAWIYSLSRKRLNDLFSAVLVLSAASEQPAFGQLLTVFELRTSASLTETAWAYYQHHYPNDRLASALKTLMAHLPEQNRLDFVSEIKTLAVSNDLPRQLARRLAQDPKTLEGARLFQPDNRIPIGQLRETFPLVTAYTDLTSLSLGEGAALPFDTGLCGYMIRLALMPETPFAAAFMTAYFLHADDTELATNADLFIQALRISRPSSQVALLQHYLGRSRLSAPWSAINGAIRDLFGVPSAEDTLEPAAEEQAQAGPQPTAEKGDRAKRKQKRPLTRAKASDPSLDQPLADLLQTVRDQLAGNGKEESQGSIWQQVPAGAAARFRQWALIDQWRQACVDDLHKLRFIERYGDKLVAAHHWDEKTLLVDLGAFFLANHQDQAGLVWYYDPRTIAHLGQSPFDRLPLHQPQQPVITAREAVLDQRDSNIVKLPLGEVNSLYAHDFLQRILDKQSPVL